MNKGSATRVVLVTFFIAVAIIAWREVKVRGHAPPPSMFVGAGVVYGIAGIIAELVPGLGAVAAVAWTVALAFKINAPGVPKAA